MPNWQPNWNDVVFDYGAAEAAASMLDRAAAKLRESYDASCVEHRRRSTEWRGGRRRDFDRDLAGCTGAASVDIDALRFEASRIRSAASHARYEQWSREQQRTQWSEEAAAEEAARQAEVARQAEAARQAQAAQAVQAQAVQAQAVQAQASEPSPVGQAQGASENSMGLPFW